MDHEMVRLAGVIPWERLAEEFGPLYCADNGRPAVPIRLMAGLHYLKHLKGLSDEQTVHGWVDVKECSVRSLLVLVALGMTGHDSASQCRSREVRFKFKTNQLNHLQYLNNF